MLLHETSTDFHSPIENGASRAGDKRDAAHIELKARMQEWMRRTPPPAIIILISNDTGFVKILKLMKSRGNNVILSSRDVKRGSKIQRIFYTNGGIYLLVRHPVKWFGENMFFFDFRRQKHE